MSESCFPTRYLMYKGRNAEHEPALKQQNSLCELPMQQDFREPRKRALIHPRKLFTCANAAVAAAAAVGICYLSGGHLAVHRMASCTSSEGEEGLSCWRKTPGPASNVQSLLVDDPYRSLNAQLGSGSCHTTVPRSRSMQGTSSSKRLYRKLYNSRHTRC